MTTVVVAAAARAALMLPVTNSREQLPCFPNGASNDQDMIAYLRFTFSVRMASHRATDIVLVLLSFHFKNHENTARHSQQSDDISEMI